MNVARLVSSRLVSSRLVSVLSAAILVAWSSGAAQAACPGAFNGAACNGGNGGNVCTVNGAGNVVTCDTGVTADTNGSDAKFVSPSTTSFRAYGYEGDGEAFCCQLAVNNGCAPNNPITVNITGTYQVDTLDENDATAGFSLDCSNTTVKAEDEDDNIIGSNLTTNFDTLIGDQDDDTIYGNGGDDIIEGNAGMDSIRGGDGNDTIRGGDGDDIICGNWGVDDLFGDDGADLVLGGQDVDTTNRGDGDLGDTCENQGDTTGCEGFTAMACPI